MRNDCFPLQFMWFFFTDQLAQLCSFQKYVMAHVSKAEGSKTLYFITSIQHKKYGKQFLLTIKTQFIVIHCFILSFPSD